MGRRYDVELFLKRAELFQGLPPQARRKAVASSCERVYAKGETIFHEGRPSECVWLVMEGRVHLLHYLTDGRVQTTCVMTPGESFCCLPALDRGAYPATAVAATRSKVLQIPSGFFHQLMKQFPKMLEETLCLFCSRLRQVEARGCLVHDPVEQRIARALLALQKRFGERIPLTRQEIADLVGTTVETSIRTIGNFRKRGWVRSSRGQISLLRPDALSAILP